MLVGVHGPNLDEWPGAALDRLRMAAAQVVGTLWTARPDGAGGSFHRRPVYDQVEAALDRPRYHLRVGWSGVVPLPALLDMTTAAVGQIPPTALARLDLRPLNEWNLPAEGGWPVDDLARLLGDYAVRARIRWPSARLIVPPVSLDPGDAVDRLAALLDRLTAAARGTLPFDGLAVNAYDHLASDTSLYRLAALARQYGLAPHLTELNVERRRGPERVAWLVDRLEAAELLGYETAQVFILDGQPHGAWSGDYVLSDDEASGLGEWQRRRAVRPTEAIGSPGPARGAAPVEAAGARDGDGAGPVGQAAASAATAGAAGAAAPAARNNLAERPLAASTGTRPRPAIAAAVTTLEGAAPMDSLALGRGLWIWYTPRAGQLLDPAAGTGRGIVAACRRANARWVAIKGGDARSPRDGSWPQLGPELVGELHEAGLRVFGWPYCYLDDVDREVGLARWIIAQGVDGLIADVEDECAGRWRQAERYAAAVADLCGRRLFAYAPLPVIDFHQAIPYVQFNRACGAVMPQFYRRLLGGTGGGDADLATWSYDRLWAIWDRWRETWAAWGIPTPPICPVGEAFVGDRSAGSVGPGEVAEFEASVRARSSRMWSYWELGQATPGLLDAMAAAERAATGALALPADLLEAVRHAADGIWSQTEQLAALEHAGHAVAIQSGVVAIKRALGLQPATA